MFVAVGGTDNGVTIGSDTSTDGVIWDSHLESGSCPWGIAYGNGTFVTTAGGPRGIWTSTDGINWILQEKCPGFDTQGIIYANGNFFAVGSVGRILIIDPENGFTGTIRYSETLEGLHSIAYGDGTFVAVGVNGTILTSKDGGIAWPLQDSHTPNLTTIMDVTYGNGTFVAVGTGGTIFTSTNGIEWVKRTLPVSDTLMGAIYGNNTFIAVGL